MSDQPTLPLTEPLPRTTLVENLTGEQFQVYYCRKAAGEIVIEMFGPMKSNRALWWIQYRETKNEEKT